MLRNILRFFIIGLLAFVFSCNSETHKPIVTYKPVKASMAPILSLDTTEYKTAREWQKYWYDGKAEISTYILKQSRYGEIHEGNLTNIFVTEDFSKIKQVKLDDPDANKDDRLRVLKLNQAIKFVTGIYPYSMMLSVFSPVDFNNYPHPIKVTASAQEWCGNSFFQLNNRNNRFLVEQRSYFEVENDQDLELEPLLLEDECWNLMRIQPEKLPQGVRKILPGALYLRLSHKPVSGVNATLTLVSTDTNFVYSMTFPSLSRTLNITIEKKFPFKILEWNDSYPGTDGRILTTTATLNKTMRIDYWTKHSLADRKMRAELGLPIDTQ